MHFIETKQKDRKLLFILRYSANFLANSNTHGKINNIEGSLANQTKVGNFNIKTQLFC